MRSDIVQLTVPNGFYWLDLIRGPNANGPNKMFTSYFMKIEKPYLESDLTYTMVFETRTGRMTNTYIGIDFTDAETPDLTSNANLRWIPYITDCNQTIHIIRLKKDLIMDRDMDLTKLPSILGKATQVESVIDRARTPPRGLAPLNVLPYSPINEAKPMAEATPYIRIHLPETSIENNPVLIKILTRIKGSMNTGNVYLKQKVNILHNYYVMDMVETPKDNGVQLDIGHLKQAFQPIPSISSRFPQIYKFLIAANARKEWVNVSGDESNWFILRPMMPPHLHNKLLSQLG